MHTTSPEPQLSALRRAAILATVTIGTAIYAMTITIANVALPQIQGTFSATQDQVAWVVTFNIVATAVATPASGWLAGRFGTRQVLVWAVALFTVATALCGLADSLLQLVVFRIGQGLFGAPLAPLCQAIVLSITPKERQGGATAIFGMGVVLGPVLAPTVGGHLSELYGWRWVFYMIVPLGAVCGAAMWAFLPRRHERAETRLDWTGFIALSIAIASFQLMLDRGERNDWFDSAEIIIEAALAGLAFYVFAVHSLSAERPFLSPRLLLDRNFTIGLLITVCFGMLNVTPMVLLPPLLQDLQGNPDSVIGMLLGARAVGTLLGFFVMMFGNRFDPRFWLVVGFALQSGAGFRMAQFTTEVSTWDVAIASAVQGLGVGLLWVPITLVTFATLKPVFLAEGMAIFHLLRNVASSVHISISVAVVIHTARQNYAGLVEGISPFNELMRHPQTIGAWSVDSMHSMAALSGEIERQAAMIGYLNAFYLYGITAIVVLPLIALVRRPRSG